MKIIDKAEDNQVLVLTRGHGETVVINKNIYVTVLATQGNQIKLGFEAPKEITINRFEIEERIHKGVLKSSKGIKNLVEMFASNLKTKDLSPQNKCSYLVEDGKVKSSLKNFNYDDQFNLVKANNELGS